MPVDPLRLPAGYHLIALDSVDSTNLEALRRIADGAPHGTVVSARSQTHGRGRRGRPWASPPGNLYATLVVRPTGGRPLGELSFVTGLGVAEALSAYAPVRLKWPNDIMFDGRKLGGILIEVGEAAAAIGIGINLASAPAATRLPSACVPDAPEPEFLLGEICVRFDGWYRRWLEGGFAPVREAWLVHAPAPGDPIEARLPAKTLTGTFAGLDEAGGLLIDLPDGRREVISAGDVFFGTA